MRLRFSNLFSMIALSILGVHPESSARSPQQLSVANCAATFGLPTIKTQTSENIDKAFKIKPFITGWFQPTPLKNMKVSWDDYSQYICIYIWKNVPNHHHIIYICICICILLAIYPRYPFAIECVSWKPIQGSVCQFRVFLKSRKNLKWSSKFLSKFLVLFLRKTRGFWGVRSHHVVRWKHHLLVLVSYFSFIFSRKNNSTILNPAWDMGRKSTVPAHP